MTGMHRGFAAFVESVGEHVCSSAFVTVRSIAGIAAAGAKCVKNTLAPVGKDTSVFLKNLIRRPFSDIAEKKEGSAEAISQFKRRTKMFGLKRAFFLHWKENRLAAKRRGSRLPNIINVAFPAASIAVLVITVNAVMSTDYGVAVEYDGQQIGVVTGEDVLSEAQCVVADRIKYYDTNGDYYVTAGLAIKPLSVFDDLIDENALAENMESLISRKFDEKPFDANDGDPAFEDISNKIKAFAVRVDGEFIGAVESYSEIEAALEEIKKPYYSDEYVEICFDKDVDYDLEEYVYPEQIVDQASIIGILTGCESQPEYYEVQPGDYLIKIAEAKGMTLEQIASCYATYNGQVIEDLEHSVLRAGTLIQIESEVPYLIVECKKEVKLRSTVPYESITIEDPTLAPGQIIIESEGVDGEKRSNAIITYREGVAVRKKVVDSVIYKEPVSEIIRVGTSGTEINRNVPEFISGKGNGEYIWPVGGGYISAHQGDGRNHKGIDIAAPYGTPIYAAASGTVIDAGTGWNGGYGNCIVIRNDDGNETWYAHQAELAAKVDDVVKAGQLIGYVGSTGDSTGNHLHFEVRSADGKYLNPEEFVDTSSAALQKPPANIKKPEEVETKIDYSDKPAETTVTTVTEAKQTTAKETKVSETEVTTAKETKAKETTAKETKAKETTAKETKAKETTAKETTVKETAAKETSAAASVQIPAEGTTAPVIEESIPAETAVTEVPAESEPAVTDVVEPAVTEAPIEEPAPENE